VDPGRPGGVPELEPAPTSERPGGCGRPQQQSFLDEPVWVPGLVKDYS